MLRGGGHPPLFLAIEGARRMKFQIKKPMGTQLMDQKKKFKIFTILLHKIFKTGYLSYL